MTFATAYENPPRVWGVGRVVVQGVTVPWPVSQSDIDDEAESQAPRLEALGAGPGDLVLIVSLLSEALHAVPIEKAAGRCGALYSSADATAADSFRVAYLVRRLEPAAVVGITGPVLEGLDRAGHDAAQLLGTVPAVATADEAAHRTLSDAGLAPRRWVKLGPTSAWEGQTGMLAYDAGRWDAEDEDGEVVVTNRVTRLTPATGLRTGVRGQVATPGTITLASEAS